MSLRKPLSWRPVLAWTLYDWANSAFATIVIAGLFPIFFQEYWNRGVDPAVSTWRLGLSTSAASAVIFALAAFLGALGDQVGRKLMLALLAGLGIAATAGLYFVGQGQWMAAGTLYCVASVGFLGGNVFYDSLLVDVAPSERMDFVSGLGYAMGYLGGGMLFALCVAMIRWPGTFGLTSPGQAVRLSFPLTAAWWAVFTVPLLLVVKSRKPAAAARTSVWAALDHLRQTFTHLRQIKAAGMFLLAYWLYIDGVDTVILMATMYGKSIGLSTDDLMKALLMVQFIGFPAAIAFGRLGERIGTRLAIFIGLCVYIGVCVWGFRMQSAWEFYALAVAVGLVQGGVQSLSRSLFARLIPPERAGEFFGFYNMLGKFATFVGPLLMGGVTLVTGNPRMGILSLIVLFVAGGILLLRVPVPTSRSAG